MSTECSEPFARLLQQHVRSPRSPHHPEGPSGGGGQNTLTYPTKSTNCQKQYPPLTLLRNNHPNVKRHLPRRRRAPPNYECTHYFTAKDQSDNYLCRVNCEAPKHDRLQKKKYHPALPHPTAIYKAPIMNCAKKKKKGAEIVYSIH